MNRCQTCFASLGMVDYWDNGKPFCSMECLEEHDPETDTKPLTAKILDWIAGS